MTVLSTEKILAWSVLIPAVAWDLRTRRIPNSLCLAAILTGVMYRAWAQGGRGVLSGLASAACVLALCLPFYLTRALGAGDCKLCSCLSMYFSPQELSVLCGSAFGIGAALGLAAVLGKRKWKGGTKIPFACCLVAGAATVEAAERTGMLQTLSGLLLK